MRTLRQSPKSLTLSLRPLRIWILSGLMSSVGLILLLVLGRLTSLRCDRFGLSLASCTVETLGIGLEKQKTLLLKHVYRADIDSLYRIVLRTDQGDIPLTYPYTALNWEQKAVVSQINNFLGNPIALNLSMSQDGRAFAYPFGIILLGGGLGLMASFGSMVVYEIHQDQQRVILRNQSLWGQSSQEFPLESVLGVELEQEPHNGFPGDCHITMRLRSGESITLSPRYPLAPQAATDLVNTLQTYLHS